VALEPGDQPAPTIRAVLPRRTKFSRRAAHDPGSDVAREQVVAANVDVVFIVAALTAVNARLLERYLTLAWESGARPVLLLTKADLVPDAGAVAADVAQLGVPVHAISVRTGLGLDEVRSYLKPGVTTALLGP
jgi:ribosome biogenesis GTPase / thiamine phosphate phosphatase